MVWQNEDILVWQLSGSKTMWQIERDDEGNLGYKEISKYIIESIKLGNLSAATPLPPTRVLAETLGVSRDTVLRAYSHLKSMGYLESKGTHSTIVANVSLLQESEQTNQEIDPSRLSHYANAVSVTQSHAIAPDFPTFNYGGVPRESLPINRWRQLMQLRTIPSEFRKLSYSMEVQGREELRQALSSYLNTGKGLSTKPSEIAIFNISFSATSLICRLLLEPGDLVAVEDPGFGGIKNVAEYLGLGIYPVPLDNQGLMVSKLSEAPAPVKLVYVTPDHQDPSGVTMSLERRKSLLSWAVKNGAWIIEDNYDGFLNYGGRLPPSLKSMDQNDSVIYLSTFWQMLYPLNTICYLVVPQLLMPVLLKSKVQTESLTEAILQLTLADIISDGFLQKHARKLERLFGSKLRALICELQKRLGSEVKIQSQFGGLTCLMRTQTWVESEVLEAASVVAFPLTSLANHYYDKAPGGEFLIYFPGLPDEETDLQNLLAAFCNQLSERPKKEMRSV